MTQATHPSRRSLLLGAALYPAANLSGCALWQGTPSPEIAAEVPSQVRPLFAPGNVNKASGAPKFVRDVHAHFFNARDVPVRGYLAGPVAHSVGGTRGELLKHLAGAAEWLSMAAPTAKNEFEVLSQMAESPTLMRLDASIRVQQQLNFRDRYLRDQSERFYERFKNDDVFRGLYEKVQSENRQQHQLHGLVAPADSFNPSTLVNAMRQAEQGVVPEIRQFSGPAPDYADGLIAFVGYMLSYRWMNLLAYQQAFSTGPNAFGVDEVFGALVDFDHWLQPPPTTAHQDQIKLTQLLSKMSGGYMKPLVAYNPWSAAVDGGTTLARVHDALNNRGFVGVKIYPPNGFRPYGNQKVADAASGAPTPDKLNEAMLDLFKLCGTLHKPVMAHTGHSMGQDAAHDDMPNPDGWKSLLDKMTALQLPPPSINAGHFGGDGQGWTAKFAALMATSEGAQLFGDLGYWEDLRCTGGTTACAPVQRLAQVVNDYPKARDRIMYGSDWLMLSQERRWDRYPFDVRDALSDVLDVDQLFGLASRRCFGV